MCLFEVWIFFLNFCWDKDCSSVDVSIRVWQLFLVWPTAWQSVMSLFFYSGVDHSWLGMAQKRSILDQKWPNMAGLSTLQSGPKGPKRDQNGQPKSFWTFGTLLGPSGPFWTISNKNWYFAPKHLCKTLFCPFGAKKSFLSEMVQKGPDGPKRGPKWSKTLRSAILVPFGLFWATLEEDSPAGRLTRQIRREVKVGLRSRWALLLLKTQIEQMLPASWKATWRKRKVADLPRRPNVLIIGIQTPSNQKAQLILN